MGHRLTWVARNHGPLSILTENLFSAIGFLSRSRFGPNTSVGIWIRFVYTCKVGTPLTTAVGSCATNATPLHPAASPRTLSENLKPCPIDQQQNPRPPKRAITKVCQNPTRKSPSHCGLVNTRPRTLLLRRRRAQLDRRRINYKGRIWDGQGSALTAAFWVAPGSQANGSNTVVTVKSGLLRWSAA